MLNTYAERLEFACNTDCFYHTVRRAKTILDLIPNVWLNEWHNNTEIPVFMRNDIDSIADLIDSVSIMLFDAMREFKLETGADYTEPEINTFFKSVDQYKLNTEVNDLHSQIIKITHKMHDETGAALAHRRETAAEMPDAKALPVLKEILEEAKGGRKNAV